MSGIYLHIPFCKQACSYCNFHFSTALKKKDDLLDALKKELRLRKNTFADETINTIYFGGGTPSLLRLSDLEGLIATVYEHYAVASDPEITLEANPDDLDAKTLQQLAHSSFNRLSLGIQSFFDRDLQFMNRAHNAEEAKNCLWEAQVHFKNISIDLIYGIPEMSALRWQENLETALSYDVPHISAYALTVEPKTALADLIKKGKVLPVDDALAQQHFFKLMDTLEARDFIHYEISNFGKAGFFSRNNTAYWQGKKYMGIGPSAHSYDGYQRSWNVANNSQYIRALHENRLPLTTEVLRKKDRYNEYVMTGLRTIWGVSLTRVETAFGMRYKKYLLQQAEKHLQNGFLSIATVVSEENTPHEVIKVTKNGKFFSDGIASDLFLLHLQK